MGFSIYTASEAMRIAKNMPGTPPPYPFKMRDLDAYMSSLTGIRKPVPRDNKRLLRYCVRHFVNGADEKKYERMADYLISHRSEMNETVAGFWTIVQVLMAYGALQNKGREE